MGKPRGGEGGLHRGGGEGVGLHSVGGLLRVGELHRPHCGGRRAGVMGWVPLKVVSLQPAGLCSLAGIPAPSSGLQQEERRGGAPLTFKSWMLKGSSKT